MSKFSSLDRKEYDKESQKSELLLKKKISLMLTSNDKENTFSAEEDLYSFPSDELIDKHLFTDDDTNPHEEKKLLNTYVKSMSSDLLIVDVESIDEDIDEKKDIYLFKKDLSPRDHFEESRSKDNPTFEEKIPLNTNPESQASNELIEGVRSIDLQPLKLDQSGVPHSAWPLQPAISHRPGSQSPLKQDKASQNAGAKIFKKRKFLAAKDRSFKSINLSQAEPGHQDLVEDSDEGWAIRKIIDMRETNEGREYKVVWPSTWVNEKDLKNFTNLIFDFRDGKRVKLFT